MRIITGRSNFLNFLGIKKNSEKSAGEDPQLSSNEMEFLPAALEVIEMPPSPIGRAITWVVIAAFTIAVIWAIVGHVDEVAVANGKVIPSGYTKTIQAEDKGVVKAIHVKEGSKVQAGDVLMELDTTITAADLANLVKEKAHLELEISRLMAELAGESFNPTANAGVDAEDIQFQKLLYDKRRSDYQGKLAAAQQGIRQAQSAVGIAQSTREKLAQQLEIASDKEEKSRILLEQCAISDFVYQDCKEKKVTLQQDYLTQATEIVKDNAALLQSMETMNNIVKEQEKDIMTTLVEDRKKLKSTQEELKKAEEKNRLCTIVAPISGTVQQVAIHTIGGVVTPAQALMLIVPEGTDMEFEVWVNNQDIGFVHEEQKAEIKVTTFNFQKFGTIDAELTELSSDAVDDKDKGLVYRAVCKAKQNYVMVSDKKVYLAPGMSVTAEIKTRQKRIIEYFLDPFLKYKSEGLRER
ncbi:MAG: HlyD family type I secretion periplasmic adaptor subunit [Pelosinus sp.]|nr:HlyD family type I secretion periplasmic adaptor subunit [Pelosinus sp.]